MIKAVKAILMVAALATSADAVAQNDVTTTYNADIAWMTETLNGVIVEVNKSQSCNVAGLTAADTTRWNGFMDGLRSQLGWVQTRPALDLPEWHPHEMDLEPVPDVEQVNNGICNQVVRYLLIARDELTAGQSTNFASNLADAEGARYTAVLDQVSALILAPGLLDLPESLSDMPSVMPGNRGPAIPAVQ